MEKLLEEILEELKAQTTLLREMRARAHVPPEAREAVSQVLTQIEGTPFHAMLKSVMEGGGRDGE